MTDLISNNYAQTYKSLHLLNPLKYLYFIEYVLLKKYEKKMQRFFDHIVLVSKKYFKDTDKLLFIHTGGAVSLHAYEWAF